MKWHTKLNTENTRWTDKDIDFSLKWPAVKYCILQDMRIIYTLIIYLQVPLFCFLFFYFSNPNTFTNATVNTQLILLTWAHTLFVSCFRRNKLFIKCSMRLTNSCIPFFFCSMVFQLHVRHSLETKLHESWSVLRIEKGYNYFKTALKARD